MISIFQARPRLHRLAAALVPLCLVSCSGSEGPTSDALLLTIDTLRGDHWGCLGDPQARTPHLDRLARGGTLAFEGRAPAPITLPSHASLMTGLPPAVHGVRDNGIFRLDPEAGTTLAEAVGRRGWTTAAFVSAFPLLAGFGLDRGFDHYDSSLGPRDDELGGMRQRTAGDTLDRLAAWFHGRKAPPPESETPLFLWVHLFDPHADYEAPEPWGSLFPDAPYRAEVAYVDHEAGRLFAIVKKERTLRRLQIVVASDHGEGLFAHGESTHGALVHASTIRVPIVARSEGYAPRLLPYPVALERVPATLLSMLGLDPELNAGGAPALDAPPTAVHAETLYPWFNFGWAGLRCREENGWRLISGPVKRLYRLEDDPGEQRDLAAEHPDVVADLQQALEREWEDRARAAYRSSPRDLSAEEAEALRSLGYVAGGTSSSDASLERAFREGDDPHDRLALVDRINEGLSALRRGDTALAIAILRSVVREDAANRLALEHLGRALKDEGRLVEARSVLRSALALGTNPDLVYLDLAQVESVLEDREGERDALTRALAANPRSVEARIRLSKLLVEERRLDEARTLLVEAVEIRPRSAHCHLNLAQIYDALQRPEDAAVHWRRVLELDPDGQYAPIARRALARPPSGSR